MNGSRPSASARAMMWLVMAVTLVLLVLGIYWYDGSLENYHRFWNNILDRLDGPLTFRFYFQPAMALLAALPDGINDARTRRESISWSALSRRLHEGSTATARIVLLGLSIDAIYQFKVLGRLYPGEALMIAVLLAVIPYFIFRWFVQHFARWWPSHGETNGSA